MSFLPRPSWPRLGADSDGATGLPSPSPTCPYPHRAREDAADWDGGARGQVGPRRRARGAGGPLRAGLPSLLPGLPARTRYAPWSSAYTGTRWRGYLRPPWSPSTTAWIALRWRGGWRCGSLIGRCFDSFASAGTGGGYSTAQRCLSQQRVPPRGRCSHRYWVTSLSTRDAPGGVRPRCNRGCGGKPP